MPVESKKKKYQILLYGLAIGIVFDLFFYDRTLGISYPIFMIIILAAAALAFAGKYGDISKISWIWVLPVLLLSATFAIYSNQVLKILNFIVIPYLAIMTISLVSGTNRANWADIRFLADFYKRIFVPFRYIHMPFVTFFRTTDGKGSSSRRVLPRIAIGILVSVPVLAVIIWLLSSADVVFRDLFVNIPISKIIKHFFVILAVTVYAACFYWAVIKAFDSKKKPLYEPVSWTRFLDPVVLLTVLFLLNVVYTVFSVIQFTYLFGGESFMLPSSYTYAEYARKGFFELVVVAVINFIIILITVLLVKKQNKKIDITGSVLLTLLAGFTFVMLASAFYRMLLYEQAYGFTYLRIFVQVFMVLLFFLFIANIVFIWNHGMPVIKTYFIITLAVYIMLNLANVDMIIASNNIHRYRETGQIDMEYIKGLSYDAVPEIVKLAGDSKVGGEVMAYLADKKKELSEDAHWQSLNLSRVRAYNIIGDYVK